MILETHAHTSYSKDSLTPVETLLKACRRKGIDRIVITDHNTIAGGLEGFRLDPQRVIVGEEIMTLEGELLAAFVKEEVPPDLPPLEAIARLRSQGAFISVSHPFDVMRKGHWDLPALLQIAPLVDAIETFNSRCFKPSFNTQARTFAQEHHLPGTVGSDAHAPLEVGMSTLELPDFQDADSLRRLLPQAMPHVRLSPPWVFFFSRYAKMRKKSKEARD